MRGISTFACMIAFGCAACHGQTNTCGEGVGKFFLPPVQLRGAVEGPKTSPVMPTAPSTATPPPAILESTLAEGEFHSRVIRTDRVYLTRSEPGSFVESFFTPEVIRVGKASVSCTLVTAIKRKNPLCLLNPFVFQVSW